MGFKVGCPRIAEIQSDEEGRPWVNFSTASYPTLPCDSAPFKGKLHSEIISSDLIVFFSVESHGKGPRSKFKLEDCQQSQKGPDLGRVARGLA